MTNKNISTIILSRLGGLLLFIILLLIANIISNQITNPIILQIIYFLNNNIGTIIFFTIIFFLADLFSIFIFPFNLPYPLFNALGSILLILFLFQILPHSIIIQEETKNTILNLQTITLLIVTLIVLIVGYTNIFSHKEKKRQKSKKKQQTNWEDVGNEFRELIIFFSKKLRKVKKKK
jgi:hypothetical protein